MRGSVPLWTVPLAAALGLSVGLVVGRLPADPGEAARRPLLTVSIVHDPDQEAASLAVDQGAQEACFPDLETAREAGRKVLHVLSTEAVTAHRAGRTDDRRD